MIVTLPTHPTRIWGFSFDFAGSHYGYGVFNSWSGQQAVDNIAWFVRLCMFTPAWGATIFYNGSTTQNGYGLCLNDGGLGSAQSELGVQIGGLTRLSFGTPPGVYLTPGVFQNVIVSRENGVWHLMVDGVDYLVSHSAGSQTPLTPTVSGNVGGAVAAVSFFGIIERIAYWSAGSPPLSAGDKASLTAGSDPASIAVANLQTSIMPVGANPETDLSGHGHSLTIPTINLQGSGGAIEVTGAVQGPQGSILVNRRRRVR